MNALRTRYAIYDPATKRWFRGASWWRWTRFECFAAWHDDEADGNDASSTFRFVWFNRDSLIYRLPDSAVLVKQTREIERW